MAKFLKIEGTRGYPLLVNIDNVDCIGTNFDAEGNFCSYCFIFASGHSIALSPDISIEDIRSSIERLNNPLFEMSISPVFDSQTT